MHSSKVIRNIVYVQRPIGQHFGIPACRKLKTEIRNTPLAPRLIDGLQLSNVSILAGFYFPGGH